MSYQQLVSEHQRLVILKTLASSPQYSANNSLLFDSLESFGVAASRDQVRSHLHWLEEQGLVTLSQIGTNLVLVATCTSRGVDVAHGHAQVPGVKRPSPRG